MNKVIHKKNIKYIKLCLISPAFELIINFVYIVSFLLLSFKFYEMGTNFSNYDINLMTKDYLDEKTFFTIESDSDFISYLKSTLEKLYTFDAEVYIPVMFPLGSIKMIKYIGNKDTCSSLIESTPCNTYQCVVSALDDLYSKSNCGRPYVKNTTTLLSNNEQDTQDANKANDPFEGLIGKFSGFYSSYNLFLDGEQIDLTIDEYIKDPNTYEDFIKDPDLKCKH